MESLVEREIRNNMRGVFLIFLSFSGIIFGAKGVLSKPILC